MDRLLRSQHGPAINPADPALVAAVTARLSALAEDGESFTTPDASEAVWAAAFAARAVNWKGFKVRVAKGAEWQACHDMTSDLVASDPARYRHVFGYARDRDTHWRTHSWVHDTATNSLIEMTPGVRKAYLGAELTPIEASVFLGPV